MGWFAPAILPIKILLQRLWSLHLDWDEIIPTDLAESWRTWRDQLKDLSNHPIPRRLYLSETPILKLQLHGFADASSVAYGGVVYLRVMFVDTTVSVSLVVAKSRVAPIKSLTNPNETTIPKLELCAAVLTAKLLRSAAADLSVPVADIHAWSDSSIVLEWIKKPPGKLTVFVANRVAIIQDKVPSRQWRHVPTGDNPADVVSRGTSPRELIQHRLWWHGPPWLSSSPSEWPSLSKSIPERELPGIKATAVTLRVDTPDHKLWHRYSLI